MLRFNDTITTPPGGFQYRDDSTGFKVTTRSWRDLLKKVFDYRVANGGDLSPGWDVRLEAECCLQQSLQGTEWCQDDQTFYGREGEGIGIGDVLRALHSFAKILASGVAVVEQSEAERRAAICAECPLNKELAGCWGCNGINSFVNAVRGQRSTSLDDKLHVCSVCRCPIKAKVHIPSQSISNIGLSYPSHCWQHQLIQACVSPAM